MGFMSDRMFWASVFNLMNSMIGAGVLSLAFVLSTSGVFLYLVCSTVIAYMTYYCSTLLLNASKLTHLRTLEELAERSYGKWGRYAAVFAIFQHCFSGVVSYCLILNKELPVVINTIANWGSESDKKRWKIEDTISSEILLVIVLLVFIFPIASFRKITFLGTPSLCGMVIMYVLGIIVVIKMCMLNCGEIPDDLDSDHFKYPTVNGSVVPQQCSAATTLPFHLDHAALIPTLFFSFIHQESLMPVFSELKSEESENEFTRMVKIDGFAVFFVYILYTTVAFGGYYTFYNYTQDDFLMGYLAYDSSDILVLIMRICVLLCVSVSIPLLHYAARKTVCLTIWGNDYEFSWGVHIGVMVVIIALAYVCAIFIPTLTSLFGITGSIGGSLLIMIFPSSFYLKIVPRIGEYKKLGLRALNTCGWLVMMVSLFFNVQRLIAAIKEQ